MKEEKDEEEGDEGREWEEEEKYLLFSIKRKSSSLILFSSPFAFFRPSPSLPLHL